MGYCTYRNTDRRHEEHRVTHRRKPGVHLHEYDAIIVNSSAGKDSQVALGTVVEHADRAGVDRSVITVLHCDLGDVEWDGTRELAEKQAAHYGLRFEVRRREQGGLLEQVEARGMWPSSAARYCTSDQKRAPARRLMTQIVRELGPFGGRPARLLNVMGLRAAESPGRAKKAAFELDTSASNGKRQVFTWLPVHDWTDGQVWSYIRNSGVPYHRAYDDGMTRLSCSLCVLASKKDLIRACQLRPDMAARYAALEARIGHKFRADISMAELIQEASAV
jgi:3'-phosphoadenosine 5'-phosphosulfate sulfotransferase (PAPS reductase)/FAD synthetase